MSDESSFDPYAPPKADLDGPSHRARVRATGRLKPGLRKALRRLNEHLSDQDRVATDLRAAGPRLRTGTRVFVVLFLVSVTGRLGLAASDPNNALLPIAAIFTGVCGLLGIILLVMDLSLVKRDAPATPEATLKSFLKSFAMGRHDYAWATLCPTAREQMVQPPSLGPVATGEGEFSMEDETGLKAYAQTFARPGRRQMRQMSVKRVIPGAIDGDVATVEVDAVFQSWPNWVTIVAAVGFALFRPLIIVGAILYFAMRKRFEVRFTKTLLRGKNGLWYVYDADLLESSETD